MILVEKKPNVPVRLSDAISARRHLVEKGLIEARELDTLLGGNRAEAVAGKRK